MNFYCFSFIKHFCSCSKIIFVLDQMQFIVVSCIQIGKKDLRNFKPLVCKEIWSVLFRQFGTYARLNEGTLCVPLYHVNFWLYF